MSRKFTIGRERTCDFCVADESVSRLHAEIWLTEDGILTVADRGSSNGTVLVRAGIPSTVTQEILTLHDEIKFGASQLKVKDVVDAIEVKNPGALTPKAPAKPAPPPLPPPPPAPKPVAAPPMPAPPAPAPPPPAVTPGLPRPAPPPGPLGYVAPPAPAPPAPAPAPPRPSAPPPAAVPAPAPPPPAPLKPAPLPPSPAPMPQTPLPPPPAPAQAQPQAPMSQSKPFHDAPPPAPDVTGVHPPPPPPVPGQQAAPHHGGPLLPAAPPPGKADPVVGWLVCLEGPDRGRDYPLRSGENTLGRAPAMDVCIANDAAVSRDKHAIVTFEGVKDTFLLMPGESQGLLYLNGENIRSPRHMKRDDVIEVGRTKLVFIPFCDGKYHWGA